MTTVLISLFVCLLFFALWFLGTIYRPAILVTVLVGILGIRVLEFRRANHVKRRAHSLPQPATGAPPMLPMGTTTFGTVESGPTAWAPLTRRQAVAFSITLGGAWQNPARMLVDAATIGFTVVTPTGDRIRVPCGPIQISSQHDAALADDEVIERYLDTLDPLRRTSDDLDPFEHDHGSELVVQIGDHIAIHSPVARIGFDDSTIGYRQAARQVFEVQGTPCVEVLESGVRALPSPSEVSDTSPDGDEHDGPSERPRFLR